MSIEQRILIYVLIILMGYSLFNTNGISTDVKAYEAKIENLQVKIDSVKQLNIQLDERMTGLHSQIENIDSDINNVQRNIKQIKRKTDEKANTIDTYSFTELEEFFSARYYKRLDSID